MTVKEENYMFLAKQAGKLAGLLIRCLLAAQLFSLVLPFSYFECLLLIFGLSLIAEYNPD